MIRKKRVTAAEREKRAHRTIRASLSKADALAAAAVTYDPRLATAERDVQVESLGATHRARSLPYKALFDKRASDATPIRVVACKMFDDIWHMGHVGDFPEPRFEPQVDTSGTERAHQEKRAQAKRQLEVLRQTIGPLGYAVLEQRVVYNVRYDVLMKFFEMRKATAPKLFIEAVDRLVDHFGLADAPERTRIRSFQAPPP